jgi:hypothetical protein
MTEPEDRGEDPGGQMHVVTGPGCQNVQVGSRMSQVNYFGPGDPDESEEDPPVEEWDAGDAVDDEGGMSEFRYDWPDDRPMEAGS